MLLSCFFVIEFFITVVFESFITAFFELDVDCVVFVDDDDDAAPGFVDGAAVDAVDDDDDVKNGTILLTL